MFTRFVDMKVRESFPDLNILRLTYFDGFGIDTSIYCYSFLFKNDFRYVYWPIGKRYVVITPVKISSYLARGFLSTLIASDYDSQHFVNYWLDTNNVIQLRLFIFSKKKGWSLKDKYSAKRLSDLSRSHIYKYLSLEQIEELEAKLYLTLVNRLLS